MLFKNRIRNKANKTFDKLIVDPSFIKHNSPKNKTPFINVLAPIFSAAACLLLVAGIITPIAISQNKSRNKDGGMLKQIVEKAATLDNQNEVLREFESNASFIFGGNITKRNEDGKAIDVNESIVKVDDSEFKKGVTGNYTINCRLESDDKALVSYNVIVNEDVIEEIAVVSKKSVYYMGETVLPSDVEIFKVMETGKTVRALPTEIGIDLRDYNAAEAGKYKVTAYLQTNKKIQVTYEVEVKPLEEIDLKGKYAYEMNDNRVGSPIVYAFEINDTIVPQYPNIIMEGDYTYSIINGQVLIKNGHYGQAITYIPETREMVVSGLDGAPDMKCFLMSDRDSLYSVKGLRSFDRDIKFVAKNGYISKKALDYFDATCSGIYTDTKLKSKVSSLEHFFKEETLFAGRDRTIVIDTGYIGDWYQESDMNKLKISITDKAMGEYENSNRPYVIDETKDEVIISCDDKNYSYDKSTGVLYLLSSDGKRTIKYRKYDANVEAICQFIYDDSANYESMVYKLGESINKRFITDNILYYAIASTYVDSNGVELAYNDEPITKDMTVRGSFGHRYMSSLMGKYGENYMSYWEVTDKFGADKMNGEEDHSYYLQRVEMGQVTRTGWFHFTEATREQYKIPYKNSHDEYVYDEDGLMKYREVTLTVYKAYAHFDDHAVMGVRVHFSNSSTHINPVTGKIEEDVYINFGNGTIGRIDGIWKKMPFVGEYSSSDGKVIGVSKEAKLFEYKDSGVHEVACAVTNYTKDETTVSCYEKVNNGQRVNSEIVFKLVDGLYQFERNGVTYKQVI